MPTNPGFDFLKNWNLGVELEVEVRDGETVVTGMLKKMSVTYSCISQFTLKKKKISGPLWGDLTSLQRRGF